MMVEPGLTEVGSGTDGSSGVKEQGLSLTACDGLPREMLESGLPEHVFERMDFLWRASHCVRASSPTLSRVYSDQLRSLSAQQEAGVLPEWVSESMCSHCGAVLTPGINCRVRVRHRSLKSPSVRKAATTKGSNACRNQLVMTCSLCGGVNVRGGTERRAHHKKRRKGAAGGDLDSGEAGGAQSRATRRPRVANNLRGNFIPLGAPSPIPLSSGQASTASSTPKQKLGKPPFTPASAKGGLKREGDRGGKNRGNSSSPQGAGTARPADLNGANSKHGARRQSRDGSYSGPTGNGKDQSRSTMTTPAGASSQPPSLLEKIRKDAKKKRRQEAAAAKAGEGRGGGLGKLADPPR